MKAFLTSIKLKYKITQLKNNQRASERGEAEEIRTDIFQNEGTDIERFLGQ